MTLNALADIRALLERHLPAECRERETWQHVAEQGASLTSTWGITPESVHNR
jgi:hypothetical protein